MSFFAFPTKNSWDEDVFKLTTAGIVTVIVLIVALIAVAIVLNVQKKENKTKLGIKQIAFSGLAMALALVTSEFIPTPSLPMGGSITYFSMLFIVLIGYWFGLPSGLMCSFAYGLLQFVIDPKFYSVPQLLVDYLLAFGALGLSGFFSKKKYGLPIGYVVGVLGRYCFAVLSGVIFFGYYAPEGTAPIVYSLGYNATYILPEAVITLVILVIPPVRKALAYVGKLANE